MSAISAGAGAFIDKITGTSLAGSGTVDVDNLNNVLGDIVNVLVILKDTMDAADSTSTEAVTAATDAATQIEEIGQDVKDITEHTYQVVIPHSMSWLAGYIVSHFIDQLRRAVAILNQEVAKIEQWEAEIKVWRARFVDPNVTLWVGFRQWFDTWPRGVLERWHMYFTHPDQFAQWAAPPLIGPLVSYLAAPAHKQTRDSLTLILLKAWSEEPTRVLDAIEMWLRS
jgi:hypothetical protein